MTELRKPFIYLHRHLVHEVTQTSEIWRIGTVGFLGEFINNGRLFRKYIFISFGVPALLTRIIKEKNKINTKTMTFVVIFCTKHSHSILEGLGTEFDSSQEVIFF